MNGSLYSCFKPEQIRFLKINQAKLWLSLKDCNCLTDQILNVNGWFLYCFPKFFVCLFSIAIIQLDLSKIQIFFGEVAIKIHSKIRGDTWAWCICTRTLQPTRCRDPRHPHYIRLILQGSAVQMFHQNWAGVLSLSWEETIRWFAEEPLFFVHTDMCLWLPVFLSRALFSWADVLLCLADVHLVFSPPFSPTHSHFSSFVQSS